MSPAPSTAHKQKQIVAVAIVLALPLLAGAIEKGLWRAPQGAYSGMGVMMALPFLLMGAGLALAVVSALTIVLARWARMGSAALAFLLLYALCATGLTMFWVIG